MPRWLPDGVMIDASTGLISGTPSKAGQYTVIVRVAHRLGFTTIIWFDWTVSAA